MQQYKVPTKDAEVVSNKINKKIKQYKSCGKKETYDKHTQM